MLEYRNTRNALTPPCAIGRARHQSRQQGWLGHPASEKEVGIASFDHGTGIQQVRRTAVTTLLTFGPGPVSGLTYGLAPEGIAEGSCGTIYVDTEPGDGLSDQTGLFAITNGVARAVTITTPLAATLPALSASGYPAISYPLARPASAPGLALASCPSTQAQVPFDKAATVAARQLVGLWNTSFSYDLNASDRAWWPAPWQPSRAAPTGAGSRPFRYPSQKMTSTPMLWPRPAAGLRSMTPWRSS